MTAAGRSLFLFGLYTMLNGSGLLFVPELFLSLFGLAPAADVWVRVAGMLILLLGFYYAASGYQEIIPFVQLSVQGHVGVFFFYVVLVALGLMQPITLMVGTLDLLGAIWTRRALQLVSAEGIR
jgi:hypothetical protein